MHTHICNHTRMHTHRQGRVDSGAYQIIAATDILAADENVGHGGSACHVFQSLFDAFLLTAQISLQHSLNMCVCLNVCLN